MHNDYGQEDVNVNDDDDDDNHKAAFGFKVYDSQEVSQIVFSNFCMDVDA